MRIYITGPAGSGKTTLAKQLSEAFKITHTDLDDIFWNNQEDTFGIKRDDSIRFQMYENILNRQSWIIEGAYLSWPSKGFLLADKLIFLDMQKNILSYRIIKRFIKRKLHLDDCKKKETLNSLLKLLRWNKNQAIKMKKYLDLKNYPEIIRLSNNREINMFIREITDYPVETID